MSGSFDSLESLVEYFESSGNPTATTGVPGQTASGLFGFTNPTWAQYGGVAAGYSTAASAPVGVQENIFSNAVAANGLNDWTCAGCDAGVSNYLTNNPGALTSLPVLSAGAGAGTLGSTGAGISNPTGTTPSSTSGASPTTAQQQASSCAWYQPSCWFPSISGYVTSGIERLGLGVLAVLFIGGGIFLLALKSGIEFDTGRE